MSAREEVLARVRAALADAGADGTTPPRGYRDRPAGDPAEVVNRFAERVADYRATVVRCAAEETEATLAATLERAVGTGARVLAPDGLEWRVAGAVPDTGQSATELDRIDAVVTGATVAVAETGTVVLTHGPGQGRRALTLVPDTHLCVVSADQVVPGVPEAVARLDPVAPQTWISGPSATSDIELDRVEGVHGPRTLYVVLAG